MGFFTYSDIAARSLSLADWTPEDKDRSGKFCREVESSCPIWWLKSSTKEYFDIFRLVLGTLKSFSGRKASLNKWLSINSERMGGTFFPPLDSLNLEMASDSKSKSN